MLATRHKQEMDSRCATGPRPPSGHAPRTGSVLMRIARRLGDIAERVPEPA